MCCCSYSVVISVLTFSHPVIRGHDKRLPLGLLLKVSGLIPHSLQGFETQLPATTSLSTGKCPMSYVQLSQGGFLVDHPLGLWSWFSGVVELQFGHGK